jgi:D-arabinose 1-dehydrogenase-like Zn-dependent alcohol dehydrogenase
MNCAAQLEKAMLSLSEEEEEENGTPSDLDEHAAAGDIRVCGICYTDLQKVNSP